MLRYSCSLCSPNCNQSFVLTWPLGYLTLKLLLELELCRGYELQEETHLYLLIGHQPLKRPLVTRRTSPTVWVLELNRSFQEPRQSGEEAWVGGQTVLARGAEVRETKLSDNCDITNAEDGWSHDPRLEVTLGHQQGPLNRTGQEQTSSVWKSKQSHLNGSFLPTKVRLCNDMIFSPATDEAEP